MAANLVDSKLRQVKSCGFLVIKSDQSFLLMKHPHRYDLPKGHMEPGETEHQTALRELLEETGIQSSDIDIDPNFRFESVIPSEHQHFEWCTWDSFESSLKRSGIDQLLEKVRAYLNA
ncbi:unnamed protein product [Rotaria sp. Silwood1]|nr:unnamed protein product [Rotaria sp. Silwood1]